MGTWLRRLWYLLRLSRLDADLRDEIEAHRALRAQQLEREGLAPADAAAASRRALGNVTLARDDAREVWLGGWDTWIQDARYAWRTLSKNRTFTAAAVITVGLGVGVNVAIFTVLNGLLLRDLSAPDAHELVSLAQTAQAPSAGTGRDGFSTSEYFEYRQRAQTLTGLLAYANARGETTVGASSPQKVYGALVSCNYFDVLQQPPAYGRGLAPADCEPGADPVIVLGHHLWRTAFAADPAIIGRAVPLNRGVFTVVGVAAEATYQGPFRLGYFAPLNAGRLVSADDRRYDDDRARWLSVIGRQRDGVSLEQVRAELEVLAATRGGQPAALASGIAVARAKPLTVPRQLRGTAAAAGAILMAAVALILLIACANVANLLLARGATRGHELGVRRALGATSARVARQLLTESVLIAVLGGALGSMLAVWSFHALVAIAIPAFIPPDLPISPVLDLTADGRVVLFAVAVSLGTGLLFGLAPALQLARTDVRTRMKPDAARSGRGRSGALRGTLVAVQVALCMVLAVASGLLVRGLWSAYTIDPGFEYRNVFYVPLESAHDGYDDVETASRRQRLIAAVAALPEVEAVAYADREPLGEETAPIAIRVPGQRADEARIAQMSSVAATYFSLLDLPIVRGRAFTDAEEVTAAAVRPAIVSESTARSLWPDADPIGQTVLSDVGTLQVVGVAADAHVSTLGRVDPYYVYVPGGGALLLLKSRGDATAVAASVAGAIRTFDHALIVRVLPLESALTWWRGISTTVTTLAAGLGGLALLLASVGIYGLVSFTTTGRYREMGIRIALGATARGVLTLIVLQTMRPVAIGAAVGTGAAVLVSGALSSVLFGVSPADVLGIGGAVLLVAGVALAAGVAAAAPATRLDPATTLRYE